MYRSFVLTRKERPREVLIEIDDPEWRVNLPLPALINQSIVVAIGVPIRNVCRQSQNGDVTTDYEVRVQEVIKGQTTLMQLSRLKCRAGL